MRSHQQRQTCRLWLLENEDVCSTIFSSSSMSSAWRLAAMNAFTATDTCSGFLLSGRAVETTCAAGHQGFSMHQQVCCSMQSNWLTTAAARSA